MRRIERPSFLLACSVLSVLAAHICGEEGEPSAPKPDFFLITDYLPPAIYDGDALTACFRIESTRDAETRLELVTTLFDDAGKVVSEQSEKIGAAPKAFTPCDRSVDSRRAQGARFVLMEKDVALASVSVRLLREHKPWPKTVVRNGRIENAENAEIVVPLVRKQLKVENRAYAPLSWLVGKDDAARAAESGGGVAFVPERWRLKAGANPERVIALGPYGRDGCMPLLRVASDILSALPRFAHNSVELPPVLIFLPPEDLEVASDPRSYRVVLDGLVARLKAAGTARVLLVPPLHYGAAELHRQTLWHEVHDCAATYKIQSLDPLEHLHEKFWRVDPAVAGAYGAGPNAEGLKKLEQGLSDWLR